MLWIAIVLIIFYLYLTPQKWEVQIIVYFIL